MCAWKAAATAIAAGFEATQAAGGVGTLVAEAAAVAESFFAKPTNGQVCEKHMHKMFCMARAR